MLIDFQLIIKLIIHDLLLLQLLGLVDVLDRLEISEIIELGFSNLVVNFGRVLVEEVSETPLIEGVLSPTKDKSKQRPLERFI